MSDNRFAMMCVNRSGQTSRCTDGYETVPTGFQGTGSTAATRYAPAGARGGASRSSALVRDQSPDRVALGTDGGRRAAGAAAATVGSARGDECSPAGQAQQYVGRRSSGQPPSDRPMDL